MPNFINHAWDVYHRVLPSPCKNVYRVLYEPSFDPEVCVTVDVEAKTIEAAFTDPIYEPYREIATELYHLERRSPDPLEFKLEIRKLRAEVAQVKAGLPPEDQLRIHVTKQIGDADLERFVTKISTLPTEIENYSNEAVLDGIGFRCRWCDTDGVERQFMSGNPDDNRPQHKLPNEVFQLAWKTFTEGTIRVLLENIHGYLRRDLGLIFIPPFSVRIFGNASIDDDKLEEELRSISSQQPLLMDLSNFDGMGTMSYPLWKRIFLNRPGKTVWWASERAKYHLRAIGIAEEMIVDRYEEALAKLGL